GKLSSEHTRWRRYLKLLARGVGPDVYSARSISELWPSQIAAIEQGLLDATASKIVRMPTSAGKTRIAELAIVNALVTNPEGACIWTATTSARSTPSPTCCARAEVV